MSKNQIFTEAFVQEVIIEIDLKEFQENVEKKVYDPNIQLEDILKAPHNSAIVRLLDGSEAISHVAYPLFPAHLLLPINTGDHVWTITLGGRLFWISRKNFNSTMEDLSVVYPERGEGPNSTDDKTSEQAKRADDGKSILPRVQSSLVSVIPNTNETFINTIKEKRKHVPEVVPRFKKRPGDFVIQGSNNTLISLGSDRGFKKEDSIDPSTPSSALDVPVSGTGTIDIVTGRGRYMPEKATAESEIGDPPYRTAPPVIINELGEAEVDKDPLANELIEQTNRSEGDPDFGFDASRIYVSAKTKVDENFSLIENYPPVPEVIKDDIGVVPEPKDAAAIALKSDEIRIIARKHIADDFNFSGSKAVAEDVNGSIKIIKEGTRDGDHSTTDGEGAAVIIIQPDGTIMIDGPTIVIGTGREMDNGTGDQVFIGSGATEPIVLGNALKSLLDKYFTDMTTFLSTKYDTHFHPTGVGPSGPPTVTGDDGGAGTAQNGLDSFLSKVGKTK